MLGMLKKIFQYPRLTQNYPRQAPDNSLFIGRPEIAANLCNQCGQCGLRCPTRAIAADEASGRMGINIDQCIFCTLCTEVCPVQAITMSNAFELAEKSRRSLRHTPLVIGEGDLPPVEGDLLANELKEKIKKVYGRSLQIREVDAGSCNGCDYEINALNNPFNDLERLGMHFVASPRHADMLLVTGTATRNMEQALLKTYQATPDPKLVVAVGACACSGGIFRDTYATRNGIDCLLPVDVYIPGCPPRPQAILYGILKAIDKVK